jgi:hypothetical protein
MTHPFVVAGHSASGDPAAARGPVANAAVLGAAWRRLVEGAALVAEADGVRFGVRLMEGRPQDFAEYEGRIEVGVRRRPVGVDLVFQHSPARGHRPGGGRSHTPGRQDHPCFEGDGRPCRFYEDEPGHPHSIRRRDPVLRMELGRGWAVVTNLSPYEPAGTFVAVPSPRPGEYPHEPQRLGRSGAEDLLALAAGFDRHLVFYNAAHCGASINHAHLQLVTLREPLPIERARWVADGGIVSLEGYPARGLVFDVSRPGVRARLLQAVERLEERHRYFNLLAVGDRAWLFGRHPDREVVEGYSGVVAGYELAGVIPFAHARDYAEAEAEAIVGALAATTLPAVELLALLH